MFALPIVPRGVRPALIGLLLLVVLLQFFREGSTRVKWSQIILPSSLFILYLISISYSTNVAYGLKKVVTALPMLIYPLIFNLLSDEIKAKLYNNIIKFCWIFIISTALFCLLSFIYFLNEFDFDGVVLHYINIIRTDISGYKIHPIYLSMHIGISLLLSILIIEKSKHNLWQLIVLGLINLFLLSFMLMLIRKGPIIGLVLASGYLTLILKKRWLFALYGFSVIMVIGLIVFDPKVNDRFSELLSVQNSQKLNDETNSTNIRYHIYKCAVTKIPEAGLFGFGIGDGKDELTSCYDDNMQILSSKRYNSHNQYIGIILKGGYLGLLLFVIFLAVFITQSIRSKNYILTAIMIFYSIVMFSENILERGNGIKFFYLFIIFFGLFNHKRLFTKDEKPFKEA